MSSFDPLEKPRSWRDELASINTLMRQLSELSDPHEAAIMYGEGLRKSGMLPSDEYLAVSRRDLEAPQFRITRSTRWAERINPWENREKLPLLSGGLLAELVYADQPMVIDDLPARLRRDDPAFDYLDGFEVLAALPQYDAGRSLNLGILLTRKRENYGFDKLPNALWQANLWGRGVNNLLLRKQLEGSFETLSQTHAALEREMASVGSVQRSLLPEHPKLLGMEVAVHYQTSQRAGGDYYDFFGCEDGCHGVLIADVSGHGAAAAVLMAVTHALAQLHPGAGVPPGELLAFLNRHLANRYTQNGNFVTAFYGLFNPKTLTFTHASAGHPAPRHMRVNGVAALASQAGLPLGIDPDEQYPESRTQLDEGDYLVLYTDGITEARNDRGDLFGASRLDESLLQPHESPGQTLSNILTAVDCFAENRPPDDDRTIVVMRV